MTAVLSSMAMAMVKSTGSEVRKAVNQYEGVKARLAAESGIVFLTKKLGEFQISGSPAPAEVLSALATFLNSELPGGAVSFGGGQIQISGLNIDASCGTFSGALSLNADDDIELEIEGQSSQARRTVGLQYELIPGGQGIFEKGVVAGGPVSMSGNAKVLGANSPDEGEVLSLTNESEVYDLRGNAEVDGDIYGSNADGICSMGGNATVAGVRVRDVEVMDHIHLGVGETEIPRPDPSVFEAYATNPYVRQHGRNNTYTNIRIPANTNPTFSGNNTLRGVIYIEYPNEVKFSGNLNVQGVIVTEDPGPGAPSSNNLKFSGNTTLQGVETLPAGSEFDGLRDMPGMSILAPGFEVKFTGNFGTVGGSLVGEKFTLSGNANATIKGSVISLGDETFQMSGNSRFIIDRSEYDQVPPGFSVPSTLSSIATTYVEY